MRISDWSSDGALPISRHLITNIVVNVTGTKTAQGLCYVTLFTGSTANAVEKFGFKANATVLIGEYHDEFVLTESGWKFSQRGRSEEHTSELQSLMRISYAVFCLNKQTYHPI